MGGAKINPVHFFALLCDCFSLDKGKVRAPLPSTALFTGEESFATVAIGWSDEGIALEIQSEEAEIECVELFFDTRDLKTAGFNTRFCHHFLFLPEGSGREVTHFRTEDSHPLCAPELLECRVTTKKGKKSMAIFIPAECLHGYDPSQFDRLGFTYRIQRAVGSPQHFAAVSTDFQIDQHPSLWGSLQLVKK